MAGAARWGSFLMVEISLSHVLIIQSKRVTINKTLLNPIIKGILWHFFPFGHTKLPTRQYMGQFEEPHVFVWIMCVAA